MGRAAMNTSAPTATIIDGRRLALDLRARLKNHIDVLVGDHKILPSLAVVLVGDDPASHIYVNNKKKAAEKAGIRSAVHRLPRETSQDELLKLLRKLNDDTRTHGILVQLPLPRQIDTATVLRAIDPAKDVDGLTVQNAGRLASGLPGLFPCTPLGCVALIKSVRPQLSGLHAVVVGRSNLVGRPLAQLLLRENCTVTVVHSRSGDLPALTRLGDIVVAAAGRPGLVTAAGIKKGATVIDVGITRRADGTLTGDVDFDAVSRVAGHVTPVPGGVGPMTIAYLLANTVTAACRQHELTLPALGC
jgi:methylenetetrahydrofolate dehydrogenase (NADP+)/methenyltetrahydrofolate cyclohydrolase